GHIFKLEDKSSYDGTVTLDDTTIAVFVSKSYYIYLNSSSLAPASNQLKEQFEKIQKALDYLSLRGIQNSSVKVPLGHYLYWQLTNDEYSIKLNERAISRFSTTSGDISKLEVDKYHKGFRFFRFAQIAHDLFDAYRNLWLTFEALVTTHTSRKSNNNGKPESEEARYSRAVTELAQTCQNKELNELLKNKPVKNLMNGLYKDIRCSLFHSKHGEKTLIPHEIEQYESVKVSLTDLTIIVSAILQQHYCIRSKSSWMNPEIYIAGYKDMFDGMSLFVSDCADEKILTEEQFQGLNRILSSSNVNHIAKIIDNHVEHLFNASIAVEKNSTQDIQRFSLAKEGKELFAFTLDEALNMDGVAHFEIESFLDFAYIEKPRTYDFRI
ncbi:MAG: hypothetical protein WAW61_04845, partial [Methylococcaceae bacterium]